MNTKRFLLHLLLGTAITSMIFLISLQVPWVGMVISLLTPLPIMVLCGLWGLPGGILALLLGTLFVSALLNPFLGIIFFAEFGLLGIFLYYYLVGKALPWDQVIARSSLIVVAALAFLALVYGTATSSSLIDWVREQVHETGQSIVQIHLRGSTGDQILWITSEKFAEFVLRILPSLVILTIWFEGFLNIALFARIMRIDALGSGRINMRLGFSTWTCPDRFVWGGIFGGVLILTKIPLLVTIGLNVIILLVAIYFLQGLAIVSFFFGKNNVPLGFRVIGYTLIGLIQFLFFLVVALGLFDIWMNFRKLTPRVTVYKKSF